MYLLPSSPLILSQLAEGGADAEGAGSNRTQAKAKLAFHVKLAEAVCDSKDPGLSLMQACNHVMQCTVTQPACSLHGREETHHGTEVKFGG